MVYAYSSTELRRLMPPSESAPPERPPDVREARLPPDEDEDMDEYFRETFPLRFELESFGMLDFENEGCLKAPNSFCGLT